MLEEFDSATTVKLSFRLICHEKGLFEKRSQLGEFAGKRWVIFVLTGGQKNTFMA